MLKSEYLEIAPKHESLSEVEVKKSSEKLLLSVVLQGLFDNFELFKTVHDFSRASILFSDIEKTSEIFAVSEKFQKCGNYLRYSVDC